MITTWCNVCGAEEPFHVPTLISLGASRPIELTGTERRFLAMHAVHRASNELDPRYAAGPLEYQFQKAARWVDIANGFCPEGVWERPNVQSVGAGSEFEQWYAARPEGTP